MSFVQPPFWAIDRRRVAHPPTSALVLQALAIATSSVANPSVITTTTPHWLITGDTVTMAGHAGSTPSINAAHVVTVLSPTTFSIPVNVTVGGAGGTATLTTAVEPITLAEGKLYAGLDWVDGDARDNLMRNFIRSARLKVEHDTGLAIRLQVRDIFVDAIDAPGLPWPTQTTPLQAVSAITWTDTAGAVTTVGTSVYQVDLAGRRIALVPGQAWPSGDFRALSAWTLRIVSGFPTIAAIPAPLVHWIGVLTAHYATVARDLAVTGTIINEVPMGYDDGIQPYRLEVLA